MSDNGEDFNDRVVDPPSFDNDNDEDDSLDADNGNGATIGAGSLPPVASVDETIAPAALETVAPAGASGVRVAVTMVPGQYAPRTGVALDHLVEQFSNARYEWVPHPDSHVQLMTDYTLSARQAVRNVWGATVSYVFGMCAFHAWLQWIKKHQSVFKDYKGHKSQMGKDFEAYRTSGWAPSMPLLCKKMCEKWTKVLKEGKIAKKWWKQWAGTIHTRAELNDVGLFRGGLPATNNNSESLNSKDKVSFDYRRRVTADFLACLVEELYNRSLQDLTFCATLNQKVHNCRFYKFVHRVVEKTRKGEASFVSVAFKFSRPPPGVQTGTILALSDSYRKKGLKEMMDADRQSKGLPLQDSYDKSSCVAFVRTRRLHEDFMAFLRKPEQTAGSSDWTFDICIEWSRRFHLLRPIVIEGEANERAIGHFLTILNNSGLSTISVQQVQDLGLNGLVSCNCPMYLQRGWCEHACAYAMDREIITSFPPTMNPCRTMGAEVGAPKKARRGDTFNRQGV
jgi:hypothetical protein